MSERRKAEPGESDPDKRAWPPGKASKHSPKTDGLQSIGGGGAVPKRVPMATSTERDWTQDAAGPSVGDQKFTLQSQDSPLLLTLDSDRMSAPEKKRPKAKKGDATGRGASASASALQEEHQLATAAATVEGDQTEEKGDDMERRVAEAEARCGCCAIL